MENFYLSKRYFTWESDKIYLTQLFFGYPLIIGSICFENIPLMIHCCATLHLAAQFFKYLREFYDLCKRVTLAWIF